MAAKCVLLVDDDPLFVRNTRAALSDAVELHVVSAAEDALTATERLNPNLVLLDLLLRNTDSFWLLDQLRQRLHGAPCGVICLAKGPGAVTLAQCAGQEFFGVVRRDCGPDALLAAVLDGLQAVSTPAPDDI